MKFDRVFDILISHEGGYVDDPIDPGGATRWGISKRSYPNEDIENLTLHRAQMIYLRDYWTPCRCEHLPSGVDLAVFDMAVHSGVVTARKCLQTALGVKADGIIGPITMKAVKEKDPVLFLKMFNYARWRHMASLDHSPKYLNGWTRRVIEIAVDSALSLSGSENSSVNPRIP